MAVLRFVRDLSAPAEKAEGDAGKYFDFTITEVVMPRDRAAVVSLAEEAREGTVSFSAHGLLAELEGREGRQITAWLAWQPATMGPRPVGIVMVAQTAQGISIPWLLVDPDVRRQGVARSLVAAAIRHARSVHAQSITAEALDSWPEAAAFWNAVGFDRVRSNVEID